MGRSLSFSYKNVMKFDGVVQEHLIETINSLKVGDKFSMKINIYLENYVDEDDFTFPLTRSPSTYGSMPLPICNDCDYEYIVDNINDEPGLLTEKGIRSISFNICENDKQYFKTHRLLTDGTIRECEGLGINYIIEEITILT
jgi:hypothetical protein